MGCLRFLLSPFAVVFGATAMVLVLFVGFAVANSALGTPACFTESTWMVSDTFAAIMLGVTFVAAIVGGVVSRRTGNALTVLLMMAFAAFITVVPNVDSPLDALRSQRYTDRPESRPKDASLLELVRWNDQPNWMRYGGTIVGVTGVVFGSSLAKKARTSRRSDGDEE
jgi:hypothetical protein